MGNCPILKTFPIKCCKYNPIIIQSYRYDDYSKDKKENELLNIQNTLNKNTPKKNNELNNNNYSIEENDKNNSLSSNKINNNSKIKYSRLINLKRKFTTEEIIQMNNNLKSSKNLSFINQHTIGSKIRNLMTKQTTSTTNSAQKFIFNLPNIHEEEDNYKKEILVKILKKNLFFKINFNENQLEKLASLMEIYDLSKDNNNIFNKEDFGYSLFVMEKGEIYIFNNNLLNINVFSCNNLLINGDYCFGELCLLNEKEGIKRTYSISTLSLPKLYILNKEKYFKFLFIEKIFIKSIDNNILKNIELFKYVNTEEFLNLSKLGYILDEKENENNIFDQENKIEFLSIPEFLKLNINLTKQDPRTIYLKIEIEANSRKYFIISIHSIIEIFGINYKFLIFFHIFNNKIKEDLTIFNKIKNNYFEIISLYSIFKYKYIDKESSLGIKLSSDNNSYILILQGNIKLYDKNNNLKIYKSFDYLNTHSIENKFKLIFSLHSAILYAKYNDFQEKINNIKENFSLVLNRIYQSSFLSLLNNDEILFFLNKMKVEKYKKNDLIINEEKHCNKFYLIIEGKVKHKSYNNKTIQKYSENDCFGEIFLLDDIINYLKDTYIYTTSDNLITAVLDKEDFFILLNNPRINEYIKLKICLEDKSINFCDLYFLHNLNETRLGNLYLVHNGISLYAIKSISKLILQGYNDEKQYINNKINILKIINHRFIVKMVNKFKNDNWYFFLMEYVNGVKLNEALKYFQKSKNLLIEYIKFYSAIIFIIIDYLHSHKVIHRDIKINNFIIENDGYLKLIDIGSSKKILNGYAKTMLGTPHYMAPEIVEGLNYSFSSDFYSIGICIYYLVYNKFPFGNEEKDVYKIYQEILSTKDIFCENEKKEITNEINELIRVLLIKDQNIRYSNIESIKSSLFYKGFDWDLLYAKKLSAPFKPKNNSKFNNENILNDFRIPFESFIEKEKVLSVERDTSHVKIENEVSDGIGSGILQQIDILNENF